MLTNFRKLIPKSSLFKEKTQVLLSSKYILSNPLLELDFSKSYSHKLMHFYLRENCLELYNELSKSLEVLNRPTYFQNYLNELAKNVGNPSYEVAMEIKLNLFHPKTLTLEAIANCLYFIAKYNISFDNRQQFENECLLVAKAKGMENATFQNNVDFLYFISKRTTGPDDIDITELVLQNLNDFLTNTLVFVDYNGNNINEYEKSKFSMMSELEEEVQNLILRRGGRDLLSFIKFKYFKIFKYHIFHISRLRTDVHLYRPVDISYHFYFNRLKNTLKALNSNENLSKRLENYSVLKDFVKE